MWWHRPRATVSRFAPLATVLALAGLLGGCFEPLYGEKTLAGGPGLSQRLGELLGIPASPFAPLDALERSARASGVGPQFAQAFGLALRAA